MKMTLSANHAASILAGNPDNGFSYPGALALCEYLEEMEYDTGEEIEFDAVGIRCEWSEFETALEAAMEYGFKPDQDHDEDEREESALEWLRDKTQVVEIDSGYGGVVVCGF